MEVSQASHQIIVDLLAARTGQQLTESRKWRVPTALAGVFREHGISNIDQLVCLLDIPRRRSTDHDLATEVVEALLNNETYFFRDKPTFDQVPEDILPELAARRADQKRLSIWCAGCSTGQEVHSIAMLFEDQKERWEGWTIDILGTDVSHKAIRTARTGLYSQFEVQRGLGVAQMLRHFEETPEGWQILDHVPLDAAADHGLCLAVDTQVDQGRQELSGLEQFQKGGLVDVDRDRVLVATIDDTWYLAVATRLAGSPFAHTRTHRR